MPFIREIPRGLFIGDPGKRQAEVEFLIDPELSLYKYSDQEELERNAVAMRKRAPGKFEYITLRDEDFGAIGLIPVVDDRADLRVPEVDARHHIVPVDATAAEHLVACFYGRAVPRGRFNETALKKFARRIHEASGWPPADCWMLH